MSEDPIVRTAVEAILNSTWLREACCIRLRDDKLGKGGELSQQFWRELELHISTRIRGYQQPRIWSEIKYRLDEEVENGLKLSKLYQQALTVERKWPSSVERAVAAGNRNAIVDSIQACDLPATPELIELLINRNRGKTKPDTMERGTERIVKNCVEAALRREPIRHAFFNYVKNLKVGQSAKLPEFFRLIAQDAGECYEEVMDNKTAILARIMEELDGDVEKDLKLNNPTYDIVRRIEADGFYPGLDEAVKSGVRDRVMCVLKRHIKLDDCDLPTVAGMLIGREKVRNQPLPTVAEWISESRPKDTKVERAIQVIQKCREEAIRVDLRKFEDIARQLAMDGQMEGDILKPLDIDKEVRKGFIERQLAMDGQVKGTILKPQGVSEKFLAIRQNKTVNLTLTEETTMNQNKPLETITYVYGKDVTTLTKDELMEAIKRTHAKIAAFKEVDVISNYIDGEVSELEAVVSFLVSKLDEGTLATAKGKK